MTSLVAILPAASLVAANAALETAGFGPGNFNVVSYTSGVPTHAALHAWHDAAFSAAVKAIAGVVFNEGVGDPFTRTQALIEAQGAKWGAQAPALPTSGNVTAGSLYRFDDSLWSVIQTFNRTTYGADPSTYPALIRRLRDPRKAEAWRQPIDQYDSYKLVNAFTGKPDECIHLGKILRTKIDYNTTAAVPGQFWDEIDANGNVIVPPAEEWPAWHVWDGNNASLYQVGAKVSHAGKRWINATANSHWEPGVYGWTQQP